MKTTVSIEGAEFYAYHGFYDEERKSGNNFILYAEVELKSFDSNDDNIYDTVNYETIYQICKSEMEHTQKLLETVVYNIIMRMKNELDNVTSGKVILEKLNPKLGGPVRKSRVEMKF